MSAIGLLEAVSAGQVWIDVASPSLNDSLLVTVSVDPEALASITITNSPMELTIGDTLQLEVELRNANGALLTGKVVSWESTDPTVCSVDENGQLIALDNGTSQVTAFSEGLKSLAISIMVGAPTLTRSGDFQGPYGYNVSGTAVLERTADEAVVKFESNFSSQSGPGLYVYLSPNAGNVNGGVSLGTLKSTSGIQTYEIPSNVNPDDFDHVLVYCQPFRVPFGTAELE